MDQCGQNRHSSGLWGLVFWLGRQTIFKQVTDLHAIGRSAKVKTVIHLGGESGKASGKR